MTMKHKNKNRDSTASPYGLPYPEKVLSDTPSFHRQIMDNMLEGCQIIGFDWKFVYVNDAAARDGRIDKERLLDHTLMECYPGIENSMLFTNLKECMEKGSQGGSTMNLFFLMHHMGGLICLYNRFRRDCSYYH